MPLPDVHVQPCKRLEVLSLSLVEKLVLRGFFVLGKKDRSFETGLIGAPTREEVVSFLCERSRAGPFEEMETYLTRKFPESHRQTLLDNLLCSLATPTFDSGRIMSSELKEFYHLYCDNELTFQAMEIETGSRYTSSILYFTLKHLLLDNVKKLDCSEFYSSSSRWVARSRRLLLSWHEMKGTDDDSNPLSGSSIVSARTHWERMQYEHLNSINLGLVRATPFFNRLVKINIDHVVTGELIWSVGCHCPNLEDLSLYIKAKDRSKYSSRFEIKLLSGMTSLCGHQVSPKSSFRGRPLGCPKLRRLRMPEVEDVSALLLLSGAILRYLTSLEELIGVDNPGAITALLHEDHDEHQRPKSLALKSLEELPFGQRLEIVRDYFNLDVKHFLPNVTKAKLLYSKFEGSLNMLSNFPKLEILEVNSEECNELEFVPYFSHLKELKNSCQWDEKKLAGFSQRAPSLEVFHLTGGSLVKRKKTRNNLSFPKMREVKIYQPNHCDPDVLTSFLKSCRNLTHISLEIKETYDPEAFPMMNDKIVAAIVPSLKKLQVFDVSLTHSVEMDRVIVCNGTRAGYSLTEKSVSCLLNGCPDLISIGNVFYWKIPYKKIMELKKEAREKNWAVKIVPVDIV